MPGSRMPARTLTLLQQLLVIVCITLQFQYSKAQTTVTIAPVAVTESSGSGNEIAAMLTLSVSGGGAPASDVFVSVAATQGTATTGGVGNDFSLGVPFMVTFSSGIDMDGEMADVFVFIIDDTAVEAPETFTLSITVTGGGSAGSPDIATVTITDSDTASVDIAAVAVTEPSSGDQNMVVATVTLATGGALETDVVVTVTASDGTATSGGGDADYTQSTPFVVTFSSGDTNGETADVSVLIIDDDVSEAPETFDLSISVSSMATASAGSPDTVTTTITDSDMVSVDIAAVAVTEPSGNQNVHAATLTLSTATGVTLESEVVVAVAATSGTALSSGVDFTLSTPFMATFSSGEGNGETEMVSVFIIDDALVEAPETFTLSITSVSPSPMAAAGSPDTVTVTITDNDVATVDIAAEPITEPSGSGNMLAATLMLSTSSGGALANDVMVAVTAMAGTATTGGVGNDFSQGVPFMVTFSSGRTAGDTESVSVFIIDDTSVEAPETFSLSISSVSPSPMAIAGSPDTVTTIITDSDTASVDIAAVAVTEPSSGNQNRVSATLTLTTDSGGAIETNVIVSVTASDGTATSGGGDADYTQSTPFVVTFSSGDTNGETADVSVLIIDDDVSEAPETFDLSISVSSMSMASAGSPDTVTTTITDSDMVLVDIAAVAVTESSGNQNAATLTLSTASGVTLESEVVVAVTASSGTALSSGVDFTQSTPFMATFSSGEGNGETEMVSVFIIDDALVEALETFTLSISVSPSPMAAAGSPDTVTVTITDNDVATVDIAAVAVTEPTSGSGFERAATLTLTTTAGGGLAADVVVEVASTPGTATTSGVGNDFIQTPIMVTFSSGASSGATEDVSVSIIDDNLVEAQETFDLSISAMSGAMATAGSPDTVTVTITDGDMATVSMAVQDLTEPSSGGASLMVATLTLSTDAGTTLDTNVVVSVSGISGTATTGGATDDFTQFTPAMVTFSSGTSSGSESVSVSVIDDDFVEAPETFDVSITIMPGAEVTANPASDTVTITDSDMATVTIADVAVTEPGSSQDLTVAMLTLTTSSGGDLETEIVVAVTATGGTATTGGASDDLTQSTAFMATFTSGAANSDTEDVSVMILNDVLVEAPETFDVSITTVTSMAMASAGTPDMDTVTITDNDMASVSITAMAVTEPASDTDLTAATLTLSTSSGGMLEAEIVVVVTATGGTATTGAGDAADDFTQSTAFTATFASGASNSDTIDVSVMILNDDFVEGPETFDLSITTVTSMAMASAGSPDMDTCTITDNDMATVVIADVAVTEPGASADLTAATLTLTTSSMGMLEAEIVVAVTATGDTATTGGAADDFTQSSPFMATFTIGAGNTDTEGVSVMILNDNFVEAPETFDLSITTLTSMAMASAGTPDMATVTITDNDLATVVIADVAVTEPGSSQDLTVALLTLTTSSGGDLETEIVVAVTATGGTATTGGASDDFTQSSPFMATFTSGASNSDTEEVSVMILNDNFVEAPETFDVSITSVTSMAMASAGTPDMDTCTITDNDMASVSITSMGVTEPASDTDLTAAILTLSTSSMGMLEAEIVVTVTATGGTATTGAGDATDDFTQSTAFTATFTSGASNSDTEDVSVMILNDNFVEAPETFDLSITSVTSMAMASAGSPDMATVTITDNDMATVVIADVAVTEPGASADLTAATLTLTTSSGGSLETQIVVAVTATGDTATTGGSMDDFTQASAFMATFTSGAASSDTEDVSVMILNDALVEAPETFDVSISGVTSDAMASAGSPNTDTVTITDNDMATVTIAEVAVTEPNSNQNLLAATLTLTTSSGGALENDIEVVVAATGGTATTGGATDDFTLSTAFTATFTSGAADSDTEDVSVMILNDNFVEAPETFTLSITSITSTAMASAGTPDMATVTITDNDMATITISEEAVTEPGASADLTAATLTLTTSSGGMLETSISVVVTATGGTATTGGASDDFTQSTAFTATFISGAADSDTEDVSVRILNDDFVEAPETFIVSITTVTSMAMASAGTPDMATVTITDNDMASVSITAMGVTEPASSTDLTAAILTLSTSSMGMLEAPIVCAVTATGGTATTGGASDDFTQSSPFMVTFTVGADHADTEDVSVMILNDNFVEAPETFDLSITSVTSMAMASAGSPDMATVTITDNDMATVVIADVAVTEPGASADLTAATLTLTTSSMGMLEAEIVVTVTATGDTATTGGASDDFTQSSPFMATFTIGAGNTDTEDVSVMILNDNFVEAPETFDLSITTLTSMAMASAGTPDVATVTITDNDMATVVIADVAVTEPASNQDLTVAMLTLTTSSGGDLETEIVVTVTATGGTATTGGASDDFTQSAAFMATFTVGAGDTDTEDVSVMILNDNFVEAPETFDVSITTVTSMGMASAGTPDMDTVTITDNDMASVSIMTMGVTEPASSQDLTAAILTLSTSSGGALEAQINVVVTATGGTATTGGATDDFTQSIAFTTSFTSGAADSDTEDVSVMILNDNFVEAPETFTLSITSVTSLAMASAGSPDMATVTITDNDMATVVIADVAVTEPGMNADLTAATLTLTTSSGGMLEAEIVVAVTATGDTATTGGATDDFTQASPFMATFTSGAADSDTRDVSVMILNDNFVEAPETFDLSITTLTSMAMASAGTPDMATVTITDNDMATVVIADVAVTEPASNQDLTVAMLTLTTSSGGDLETEIVVAVTATGGTATTGGASDDFTQSTAFMATFTVGAGDTDTEDVSVMILNDNFVEAPETFDVSITSVTSMGMASAGTPDMDTVTITDNDMASVSITAMGVTEPVSSTDLTAAILTLSTSSGGMLEAEIVVAVTATGGTATTGGATDDFTQASPFMATFTVGAGNTDTEDVSVIILNDNFVEAPETFDLSITTVTSMAMASAGSPDMDTCTITDNDMATVVIADVAVTEPASNQDLTVAMLTLTTSSGGDLETEIVVAVTATGGTATTGGASDDFTQSSAFLATFTVGAGNTDTEDVSVMILNDNFVEAPETFDVSITSVTSMGMASAGTPDMDTVTITDNDMASVSITAMGVTEPASSQDLTAAILTLSTSSGGALEAQINVVVTATGGTATTGGASDDFTQSIAFTTSFTSGAADSDTEDVSVMILNDNFVEAPETFTLSITSVTSLAMASAGSPDMATVTITDNDMATVVIADVAVTEPGASVDLTAGRLTLTTSSGGMLEAEIVVAVTATGDTATTGGATDDFTQASPFMATFTSGAADSDTRDVSVMILNDNFVEAPETFDLSITTLTSMAMASAGTPDMATVTITDNDMATVVIADVAVTEPASNQDLTVAMLTLTTSSGGDLETEIVVAVTATGGTATTGGASDDFTQSTAFTATFTVGAGDTDTEDVSVMILNDNFVEAPETFTVSITSITSMGMASAGTPDMDTVTITDNDMASVSIAAMGVTEPASSQDLTAAILTLSTSSGGALEAQINVVVTATGGTATTGGASDDFTQSIAFTTSFTSGAADSDTEDVSVMILNDNFVEAPETFTLSITSVTSLAMASAGSLDMATVTITDNDMATVVIADVAVTEPGASADLTAGRLTLSTSSGGMLEAEIVVAVTATGDTATTGGASDDFTQASPFMATFTSGAADSDTRDVSVMILNDNFVEAPETFDLSITTVTSMAMASAGTPDMATVTITDNDMATVVIADVAVTEPASNQDLTVAMLTLTTSSGGDLETEIVVAVTATGGTATTGGASDDFTQSTAFTATFTVGAGDTDTEDVSVMILNDNFVEAPETFTVSITSVTSMGMASAGTPDMDTVTITDNDMASVSITAMGVTEPASSQDLTAAILTLSTSSGGMLEAEIVVAVTATGDTATTGGATDDFTQASPFMATFTVGAGNTDTEDVSVMILNDNFVEAPETFDLSITTVTSMAMASAGSPDMDTCTITDNDMATVVIADVAVTEPGMNADLTAATLTLTTSSGGMLEAEIVVAVTATGDSATTGGATDDFTQSSPFMATFTIGAGNTDTEDVSVMILNDNFVEAPETFDLSITTVTSMAMASAGTPDMATVTITDNDMATVVIADVAVTEPGSSQDLTVAMLTLTTSSGGDLETEIVVAVTATGGTATTAGASDDFTQSTPFMATFTVGAGDSDTEDVSVMILNDNFVEAPETFDVSITTVTSMGMASAGTPDMDTVTITDNDMASVSIMAMGVTEPASSTDLTAATLTLSTSSMGMLEAEIVVAVTATGGTATTGGATDDFTQATPFMATFTVGAGNTDTEDVSVMILNDNFVEGLETFDLSITTVTSMAMASAGAPDMATVTITDNDMASVSITAMGVTEPASSTDLTAAILTLSTSSGGMLESPIVVVVTATGGTATTGGASDDFTQSAAFMATFTSGAADSDTEDVSVMILNDDFVEAPETFDLSITTVTSMAMASAGTPDMDTCTITDNDMATVTIEGVDVTEPGASTDLTAATLTLTTSVGASGSLEAMIVVAVTATPGTATTGGATDDFTQASPFMATFTIGAVHSDTEDVSVMILNDNFVEGPETFDVSITTVTSMAMASAGTPDMDTVTITDNDTAMLSMDGPAMIVEPVTGVSTFMLTVTLSTDPGVTVEADLPLNIADGAGSAMIGSDFTLPSPMMSFSAGSGDGDTITFDVTVNSDNFIEWDEEIIIDLVYQGDANVVFNNSQVTTALIDQDVASLSISGPANVVEPISGVSIFMLTVTLATEPGVTLGSDLQLSIADAGGSATLNVDFTLPFTMASFSMGDGDGTNIMFDVSVNSDNFVEWVETIIIDLVDPQKPNVNLTNSQVTTTVMDQAVASLSLSGPTMVAEPETGVTTFNLTVTLSIAAGVTLGSSLEVSVADAGGSAMVGVDYMLPGSMSFDVGSGDGDTLMFEVTVNADGIVESDENITIEIVDLMKPTVALSVDNSSTTVVISDQDSIVVGFDLQEYTADEEWSVEICVVAQGSQQRPVEVSTFTEEAFDIFQGQRQFDAGATLILGEDAAPNVTVTDDVVCYVQKVSEGGVKEGIDVVLVRLSSNDSGADFGRDLAIINVPANDVVSVSIVSTDLIVGEEEGLVEVCVALNHTIEATVIISVGTQEGTAESNMDFVQGDPEPFLVFGPGLDITQCVGIPILNDEILEDTEYFTVVITSQQDCVLFENDTAHVSIIDNDCIVVAFEESEYTVDESDGTVMFCAEVCQGIPGRNASFFIHLLNGTAYYPLDFVADEDNVLTFTLLNFNESLCINVTIEDDHVLEDTEYFGLSLYSTDPSVKFKEAVSPVYILDNDYVTVELSSPSFTVTEEEGWVTICILLSGYIDRFVEIEFFSTDGTAKASSDYLNGDQTILFTEEGQECTNITIVDDGVLEDTEQFTIILNSVDRAVHFLLRTAVVNILNSGAVTIGFSQSLYEVSEEDEFGQGSVLSVCLDMSAPIARDVVVALSTSDGSAIGDLDYESFVQVSDSVTLTFSSTQDLVKRFAPNSMCADVVILADSILEGDEDFQLMISEEEDDVIVSPDTATVVILDNDNVTIGFTTNSPIELSEEIGGTSVCVEVLDGILGREVLVDVSTLGGSAQSSVDFEPISATLTFNETIDSLCVELLLVNDSIHEANETLSIMLATSDADVSLDPISIDVTIVNDDPVFLSVNVSDASPCEGVSEIQVCVILDSAIETDVVVTIETEDISANSSDYTGVSTTFTFSQSSPSEECVTISIINDEDPEGCESFLVNLSSESDFAIFSDNTRVISILDDETVDIRFTGDTPRIDGRNVTVNFQVEGTQCVQVLCDLSDVPERDCTPTSLSGFGEYFEPDFTTRRTARRFTMTATPFCGQPPAQAERMFRKDNDQCSAHYINDGVTVGAENVTVEFEGTGPDEFTQVSEFECRIVIDGATPGPRVPCESPFMVPLADLSGPGNYTVNVRPVAIGGCARVVGQELDFEIQTIVT